MYSIKNIINISKFKLSFVEWLNSLNKPIIEKVVEAKLPLNELKKELQEEIKPNLKIISNKEFLKIDFDERLKLLTEPKINSNDIRNWSVKTLKFTFTFDWVHNDKLYLTTTAWQLLADEVGEVTSWDDNITYYRTWLKWEFFSEDNRRLVIHEWTELNNIKIRNLDDIKNSNNNKYVNLVKDTKYRNYPDILKNSIDRNIDPNLALIVFWEKLKDKSYISVDRLVLMEDIFTDIDRERWYYSAGLSKDGKYDKDFSLNLIRKYTWNTWKNKSKEYWFSDIDINNFDKRVTDLDNKANKIRWINVPSHLKFIEKATIIAKEIEKVYGIPWKVTVAQAALESWYGTSSAAINHNAYFWIKAYKKWQNSTPMLDNWEGKTSSFLVHNNMTESFIWYAKFLTENPRYSNAFMHRNNPEEFLKIVANAWYAQDKDYINKVISIMRKL